MHSRTVVNSKGGGEKIFFPFIYRSLASLAVLDFAQHRFDV